MKALYLLIFLVNPFHFLFADKPTFHPAPEFKLLAKADHKTTIISIFINKKYSSQKLETLYKIECYDTKEQRSREFVIKKTDARLKEKTSSNFILIEDKPDGRELVYPFGWEKEPIQIKEMRDDCILILESIVIAI